MAAEVQLFFEAVVREDRSVAEFLNADWTFANAELAEHYKVKDLYVEMLRRMEIDAPKFGDSTGGLLHLT